MTRLRGPLVLTVIACTGLTAAGCALTGARSTPTATGGQRLACRLRRLRFHTLPALHPTGFCVAHRAGASPVTRGLLVTPRPDPRKNPGEQFGLMLISPGGKLLWYQRRPTKVHDLKVVT